MASDKVPSFFPERPIRPLPKRKLREKLSPEVVRTIQYPPSTLDNSPLFYHPANVTREPPRGSSTGISEDRKPVIRDVNGLESDGVISHGHSTVVSSAEEQPQQTPREEVKYIVRLDQGTSLKETTSAASSIDGYDSLENTNNKKKRKIPSASDTTLRGSPFTSNGSVEVLELGSGPDDGNPATAQTYALPGALSMYSDGISGPGRGRLGRIAYARTPLRALSEGNNTWPNKPLKTGLQHAGTGHGGGGIISNAIAKAERLIPSGQENAGSLLQHRFDSEKSTRIASQFTFTCGSQVTGLASWPDNSSSTSVSAEYPQAERLVQNQGTSARDKVDGEGRRRPRRDTRRQLERELALAARDRQQAAVDAYYHNPPRLDDIWICEFCEYERIFGSGPKALIREYEMKDRRLRQEEAHRRRLLEKAKAKSRKGKKGSKTTKAPQSAAESPIQVSDDQTATDAAPMEPSHSNFTQSDNDYEDKVDDYRSRNPPDILGLYGKGSASQDAIVGAS